MIQGYGMGYDKNDSLVDIVIERTEKYYNRYNLLPSVAYVWQGITDEEEKAIKDLGNITEIVKQYNFMMVLVGRPKKTTEEVKERLSDGKKQETW